MTGVLLDSDILIELLRGRNAAVKADFEGLLRDSRPLSYSSVSTAEIGHGVKTGEKSAVRALLGFLECLPTHCDIAGTAGEILNTYHRSHGVELGDALIAATCIHHHLELWTRNRKHYPDTRLSFFR